MSGVRFWAAAVKSRVLNGVKICAHCTSHWAVTGSASGIKWRKGGNMLRNRLQQHVDTHFATAFRKHLKCTNLQISDWRQEIEESMSGNGERQLVSLFAGTCKILECIGHIGWARQFELHRFHNILFSLASCTSRQCDLQFSSETFDMFLT